MESLTPAPLAKLTQLGIEPAKIKFVQPRTRRAQYQAIVNWLTKYQPSPDTPNRDQVKGYIQAFYHLCDMEEWGRAASLISTKLNTPTEDPLHYQLKLWGDVPQQMSLYEALIDHVAPKWNGLFLQFLGTCHQAQGQYVPAKQCLDRSLSILQAAGDMVDQGMVQSN